MSNTTCSACSGNLVPAPDLGLQLTRCASCGGVHGITYRGDAAGLVGLGRPMQTEAEEPRYFDLTVLGSEGVSRVHGWYDPTTRRVVQYG